MNGRAWTEDQLATLRAKYGDTPTVELARELGHSLSSTYNHAYAFGLKKTAEFNVSEKSGRLYKGGNCDRGIPFRFKPGQDPWNKGSHFVAGGRSAETRFKKGTRPHTWVPIGTYRINADGYLDRKITDEGPAQKHWAGVHRLVWQDALGPIPPGCVVVFKSGRRTTELEQITLNALELLTRKELMARNTVHNLPKELKQVVLLRGALVRQINKRSDHDQQSKND